MDDSNNLLYNFNIYHFEILSPFTEKRPSLHNIITFDIRMFCKTSQNVADLIDCFKIDLRAREFSFFTFTLNSKARYQLAVISLHRLSLGVQGHCADSSLSGQMGQARCGSGSCILMLSLYFVFS